MINAVMDENLPPHLAVMDRSTPKYRVHRGKEDTRMDKSVRDGMEGDREFAQVKVCQIDAHDIFVYDYYFFVYIPTVLQT